jgi:hypothetical protein
MTVKYGFDAKLYYCAAGIGGTPSWIEITNVKNLRENQSVTKVDLSTRAGLGRKAEGVGLIGKSYTFDMVWNPSVDTAQAALRAAFYARTLVGFAVMDGTITTAGSTGDWFDGLVTGFSKDEALDVEQTVSVEIAPTYSANAPVVKTITT